MGPACCRLGNEGPRCRVVDGMIVPQPRDKGWGRRALGREVLKFCTGVGRYRARVWGERPQPCHLEGGGEERATSSGGTRKKGWLFAALQS